jgi:aminopeptidase N
VRRRPGLAARSNPPIRRADYRPPAWLVPEIALEFDLDPQRTRVRARLEVRRNGEHREPLRLDGDGLKLLSVTVDGKAAAHKLDRQGLVVRLAGDSAVIETVVEIVPSASLQQGLFVLGEALCTQCEPEHFRRLTFFPDRPDVLSRFTVTLRADKARFPVLLSNGDCAGAGELGDGRHWAEWRDPHPKPCYLFALVAGHLVADRARYATSSGRAVELAIWTPAGEPAATAHAMASLVAAMRWDEEVYGREYDLSAYNVVAIPGFRFGAMENKGLAIYAATQVLADPATATDADLDAVAALVAHEYFHNWSGNRVTCRDWFELALKEGFTVFRDQCFSADQGSQALKRIEDVRALRAAQFAEDAGPRPQPVRPESYGEVADLFSPTVYLKGAEVVRMIHTVLGPAAFRGGADLFFARHDGRAATCEDLLAAMTEASGVDLTPFVRWFGRAGTPRVRARLEYDAPRGRATLMLEQPVAEAKPPLPIPQRVALFGAESGAKLAERLLVLERSEELRFDALAERPLLSVNRGFSAPVLVEAVRSLEELAALARCDNDPVARWEAMQELVAETLRAAVSGHVDHGPAIEAMRHAVEEPGIEPGFLAEMVSLPGPGIVATGSAAVDPGRLVAAWRILRVEIGRALEPHWRALAAARSGPYVYSAAKKGGRRLRIVALGHLLSAGAADAGPLGLRLLEEADNMTEIEGALRTLADSDAPERTQALAAFHRRYRSDPRLIDRWFSAQALSTRGDTFEAAPRLLTHPDFTLAHPTRLDAIAGAFAANFTAFHHPSGRGYAFIADVALAADRIEPATAARYARSLAGWRRFEPGRSALMKAQLERIAASAGISRALADTALAALA